MNSSNSVQEKFSLHGKVAVITGGAGLLGAKHAEAIAEYGGITILVDIDKKNGEKVAKSIKSIPQNILYLTVFFFPRIVF